MYSKYLYYLKKSWIMWLMLLINVFFIFTGTAVSINDLAIINTLMALLAISYFHLTSKSDTLQTDLLLIDPLTKLPNKYGLEKHFMTLPKDHKFGLITLDIDDFKKINDRYGHKTGDHILINLSQCILSTCGQDAFVCRSYGDEFTIVFPISKSEDALIYAQSLFHTIKAFLHDNTVITLSNLSMGIALYPEHATNFQDLYKFADYALYYRKHDAGKNGYTLFSQEIFTSTLEDEVLAQEFSKAIDNNEILLTFQPQFHSNTMKIVGAEVLTRWQHPRRGLIYPDKFLPIAEKNNLLRKLDFYVFQQACKQMKKWEQEDFYPFTLSVNMTTSTICDRDIAHILKQIIIKEQVNPSNMIIEMTEELGLTDFNLTKDVLEQIRNLGIKIALDDFGKGYSSLIYLEKIPINVLKIDKEFITDIDTNSNARLVYKTISELAEHLSLKVVSEGIETEEQLNILRDISHSVMQGYHFSRPLTLEQFTDFMTVHQHEDTQHKTPQFAV